MKKDIIFLSVIIFFIVACSKENLDIININCKNLFNPETVINLTPSKELLKVEVLKNITVNGKQKYEKKKKTQLHKCPSEFTNSKLESKILTFNYNKISEQSCMFTPILSYKRIGRDSLKLRFVCGPKDKVHQKFNEERSDSKSIQEGATGIASFWAIKNDETVYSLLSGQVDCFVDIKGVVNLELGESIGRELEGNLG